MKRIFAILFLIVALLSMFVFAHSGRTDARGGHWDRSAGTYHYHHGYGPHSHPGGICPYNSSSSASTNASQTSSDSDGYDEVYDEGVTAGYENGYEEGLSEGELSGYMTGYDEGYNDGYDKGYDDGCNEGHGTGYDEGYRKGKDEGYEIGYEARLKDIQTENEKNNIYLVVGTGILAVIGYVIHKKKVNK